MPAFIPLLGLAIVAVCGLIAWRMWLRFNLLVFDRTQSVEAFDYTPQVAHAFLRSLLRRPGEPRSEDDRPAELDPAEPRDIPDGDDRRE